MPKQPPDFWWLSVQGQSMWPLMAPMQVAVDRVPWADLRRGDLVAIVSFRQGAVVVHRIVALDETSVQTRGDTNSAPDPRLPRSAVLGRIVRMRLGPLQFPVPASGASASLARRVGLLWGRAAPSLRRWWAGCRNC